MVCGIVFVLNELSLSCSVVKVSLGLVDVDSMGKFWRNWAPNAEWKIYDSTDYLRGLRIHAHTTSTYLNFCFKRPGFTTSSPPERCNKPTPTVLRKTAVRAANDLIGFKWPCESMSERTPSYTWMVIVVMPSTIPTQAQADLNWTNTVHSMNYLLIYKLPVFPKAMAKFQVGKTDRGDLYVFWVPWSNDR